MLSEHTLDQLRALRLDGMVRAIEDQATSTAAHELPFDDRLTMLVQGGIAWRDDRRVARLLKAARLKVSAACIEDINWRASRGLDRGLITAMAGGDWLRLQADHVLEGMLVGLGALVSSLRAPFEPEAGAYAPGHQHPGDGSGARIHLMAGQ